MSTTEVDEIEAKIRLLSREQRADLIRALIDELDAPGDPNFQQAWVEEARRRRREVAEGKAQPVSGERVFANLRARLRQ